MSENLGDFFYGLGGPFDQCLELHVRIGIGIDIDVVRVPNVVNLVGRMNQHFGRNATAVQANSARLSSLINQDDLHAMIGCCKCCGVTTRTAAKNYKLSVFHFSIAEY